MINDKTADQSEYETAWGIEPTSSTPAGADPFADAFNETEPVKVAGDIMDMAGHRALSEAGVDDDAHQKAYDAAQKKKSVIQPPSENGKYDASGDQRRPFGNEDSFRRILSGRGVTNPKQQDAEIAEYKRVHNLK